MGEVNREEEGLTGGGGSGKTHPHANRQPEEEGASDRRTGRQADRYKGRGAEEKKAVRRDQSLGVGELSLPWVGAPVSQRVPSKSVGDSVAPGASSAQWQHPRRGFSTVSLPTPFPPVPPPLRLPSPPRLLLPVSGRNGRNGQSSGEKPERRRPPGATAAARWDGTGRSGAEARTGRKGNRHRGNGQGDVCGVLSAVSSSLSPLCPVPLPLGHWGNRRAC